jgi:galactokinase
MSRNAGELMAAFCEMFGSGQVRAVRAPGRVNLIGDHTDYHGLPVLPMAIQREIRIAFRPRPDRTVRLASLQGFEPREFVLESCIPPYSAGDWGNYAKAAAQALITRYPELRGVDALVEGNIPPAAGLSSSSALVVACALVLLEANSLPWERKALSEWMAAGERYVGTQGGGMDQTVCLCAQPGCALKIDFTPFRTTPVPIPPHWAFVIANSLVTAAKAAGAREHYNSTRVRSQEALKFFGEHTSYPEVLEHGAGSAASVAQRMPPEIRGPFLHTISEAQRVEDAVAALHGARYAEFGRLMNESHASMRDQLRASCPEADELAASCLRGGAVGARITGAGFGGCVVALTTREHAASLMRYLDETYYARRSLVQDHIFPAEPCGGAGLLE